MTIEQARKLYQQIKEAKSMEEGLKPLMELLLEAEEVFSIDPSLSEMDEIMDWVAWVRDMSGEFNYQFNIVPQGKA